MALIRNGPVDILRYLPDFLAKDKKFKLLHDCESREHERLRLALNDLFAQFFIPIAGESGIEKWEKIIGLIPRADADLEARRRAVLLWLQSNQVSTVEFMRRLAARYYHDDANVQIEEHNEEYYFRILAESFATDYRGLLDAMEIYKPAHLGLEIHSNIDTSAAIYFGSVTGSYNVYTIAPAMAADTDLHTDIVLAGIASENAQHNIGPRRIVNENIDSKIATGARYILRKRIDVMPVIAANTSSTVTVRYFQAGKSGSYKHQEIKEEK